jgi:CheY-like chemotaxis protein
MNDPRKPRALKPRTLSVLIMDSNNFNRSLTSEILRNFEVTNISGARSIEAAQDVLAERPVDLIFLTWEPSDGNEPLVFLKQLRRLPDDRKRQTPVVLVTSQLTRQLVIDGRDAGVDEFLSRPISPQAMRQRLEMVIETPRPFVDCAVFVGPCRRRKNPADYHGAKRRDGERVEDAAAIPMKDAEEEAAKEPIRVALAELRAACLGIRPSDNATLTPALQSIQGARALALAANDHAVSTSLGAFETYLLRAAPTGQLDGQVVGVALNALEQLATLPPTYCEARESVARALGKAIQKKLAA